MKKKTWLGIALGIVAALTFALGIFTACTTDENDPEDGTGKAYVVNVYSQGGARLENVNVQLMNGTVEVGAGKTGADGSVRFSDTIAAGEYDIVLSEYPAGYFVPEGAAYKTDKDFTPVNCVLNSAVIQEAPPADKQYRVGDVMYDFELQDISGGSISLSGLLQEKRMVMLNFWDTGCGPCVSEMPEMQRAYDNYSDLVAIVAIDVGLMNRDTVSDVEDFIDGLAANAENPVTFTIPVAMNNSRVFNSIYMLGITSIPRTIIVDRYGVLVYDHTGSMTQRSFELLFAQYTADDYGQNFLPGGDNPDAPALQREKPDVAMPDASLIADAVQGAGESGFSYSPETGTDDAEYSWPWLNGEEGGQKYIYPANLDKDYSFATLHIDFSVSQAEIDAGADGKTVLAFDLKVAIENGYDFLYVILDNMLMYEYTGDEQMNVWTTCYPLVATEAGDYRLTLMFNKDEADESAMTQDMVRVRNLRRLSRNELNAQAGSLDMPRDAVWGLNRTSGNYDYHIETALDAQGYYRKDDADGYFVFADLMGVTAFNRARGDEFSVSQYAVNGDFNYNTTDDKDDPAYDSAEDDTDAITNYARAANNSRLYGLTVVTEDLKEMLNKLARSVKGAAANENSWLEFCIYFEHFGNDPQDTGYNTAEKNPVLGLMFETAYETTISEEKGYVPSTSVTGDAQYFNEVVYDRMLVPRGLYYKIQPAKSGVYRIKTHSKTDVDTMLWLYEDDGSINGKLLLETDQQLEDAENDFDAVLTYYFEQREEPYYVSAALADMGIRNSFTLTVEYLGESYFSWQYASREYATYDEEQGIDSLVSLMSIYPIEYEGKYYDALRNEDGSVYVDNDGYRYPNLNDPIYIDLVNSTHFSLQTSIEDVLVMQKVEGNRGILRRVQQYIDYTFKYSSIYDAENRQLRLDWAERYDIASTLEAAAGKTLTADDRALYIENLLTSYGDMDISAQDYDDLVNAATLQDIVDILAGYMNAFDFRDYTFATNVDASRKQDYTARVTQLVASANAGEGSAPLNLPAGVDYDKYYSGAGAWAGSPRNRGSLEVTSEIANIFDLYAKRYGWENLEYDWMRLCFHYKFIGSYTNYLKWCAAPEGDDAPPQEFLDRIEQAKA